MNNKVNEFIQVSQKVECAKLIKRRLETHNRVVAELEKAIKIGNIDLYQALRFTEELKSLQEEFMIQLNCIVLYVLPENILTIKNLEDRSIRICNEIEKEII